MGTLGNTYPGKEEEEAGYLKRATQEEAGTQRSWMNYIRKFTRSRPQNAVTEAAHVLHCLMKVTA